MMIKHKKSQAFTMMELLFVIIVLGILASLALPRLDRDLRQDAADNVLSAIRYTQHLALTDNKTDPFDQTWQKKLWAIHFTTASNGSYYNIASDQDKDAIASPPSPSEKSETAIDPSNGKYMYHNHLNPVQPNESPNVLVGDKYGVGTISFSGNGCSRKHIAFDQFGRPHNDIANATNTYNTYMSTDCNITFNFINNIATPFSIIIQKETGYAYIDGQPDS